MTLSTAIGAISPPGATRLRVVLRSRAAVVTSWIVMPPHGFELRDGSFAGHGRRVALAADFGGRRLATVARHPHVSGFTD